MFVQDAGIKDPELMVINGNGSINYKVTDSDVEDVSAEDIANQILALKDELTMSSW